MPVGPAAVVVPEPGVIGVVVATDPPHTVDDEAYEPEYVEVPTYAEAFPPLPDAPGGDVARLGSSGAGSGAPLPVASFGKWSNKMSLKSSQVTQVRRQFWSRLKRVLFVPCCSVVYKRPVETKHGYSCVYNRTSFSFRFCWLV